jgi:hypothetical protein
MRHDRFLSKRDVQRSSLLPPDDPIARLLRQQEQARDRARAKRARERQLRNQLQGK